VKRLPPWLVSMFVGVFAAAGVGALGGSSLVALLIGGGAGLLALRLRLDPPWRPPGRRRWRERLLALRGAGRALVHLVQSTARRSAVGPFTPPGAPGEGSWDPRNSSRTYVPGDDEPARRGGAIAVRCELVTPTIQVWHSTETGRAYEVQAARGLVGARAGDLAVLTYEGGRPRIRLKVVN
jgi:hypothetical protein